MTTVKSDQLPVLPIFFDFEFMDNGAEGITPISVGMCTTHQREKELLDEPARIELALYFEYMFDPSLANDFVRKEVFPHLKFKPPETSFTTRELARHKIVKYVNGICGSMYRPQFFGWYPSYDWICLMQAFGPAVNIPKGWKFNPVCLKTLIDFVGITTLDLPPKPPRCHHALVDATWIREVYNHLKREISDPNIERKFNL